MLVSKDSTWGCFDVVHCICTQSSIDTVIFSPITVELQILVFGKEDDVNVASDGESVTGIVGPNGDTIDIPAEILRGFNSTGVYTYY